MANRPVNPDKIPLDTYFQIPPGAEDVFVYTKIDFDPGETDFSEDTGTVTDDTDEGTIIDDTDDDGGDSDSGLETPDVFSIISETIHRANNGTAKLVDVVVKIDDVDGATDYEIQVVKV